MTYHNATKFIFNSPDVPQNLPNGKDLKRLWEYLNYPQKNLKYLRLVGSTGKSICANFLMSAYHGTEHQMGCLTMPLQDDIRQNILIDGTPLSFDDMARYVSLIYKGMQVIRKQDQKRVP